jgi:hypothetical protein
MPTRRQILHGMGVLAIGGLAVNKPLMQPLYPHSRAAAGPIRRVTAGRPGCGVNKGSGGTWQAVSAATGGLVGYRGYDTPAQGTPAAWPGPGASPLPEAASLQVISIKPNINEVLSGALDDQLRAFARSVPAGAMVTCWHEGEAAGNGYTTAQILSLHARCYPIFKAASPGCRYGQIVTCYTASRPSGHYPLGQWMAPGLDFYGLDGYQPASSHTVASVFGVAADQIRARLGNVPLAVTECNSAVQPGRAEWFHDSWAWAQANKCLTYFTFWDPAGSGSAYEWLPDDVAAIAALSAINATSRAG